MNFRILWMSYPSTPTGIGSIQCPKVTIPKSIRVNEELCDNSDGVEFTVFSDRFCSKAGYYSHLRYRLLDRVTVTD
ncbi:hypothetical protein OAG76_00890 [Rubripirellula sp.]|nr:hypothetical protein [Rubripirellula sp.]MDA9934834.1 hypothetical protein [Rubripirellula sp.]MDB4633936.1 hypothetical protein [Rubripirellula sp.]MDC0288196.1 hypothetical protein [Rubripirellula sp.]